MVPKDNDVLRQEEQKLCWACTSNSGLLGLALVSERGECMHACLLLRGPRGRGINKVTVQLESGCVYSSAAYKADGGAGDLKKRGGGLFKERHHDLFEVFCYFTNNMLIHASARQLTPSGLR